MQVPSTVEEAQRRRYPEQVAIAIARDLEGRYNPITLGWHMQTSHQPPMMAISVGLTRHSLPAIRSSREFVLSYPSPAMAGDALYFGTHSGSEGDKLRARDVRTQPAAKIDGILLADAVANLECEVASEHATGDHVIFVGRVLAAHVNEDGRVRHLYTLGEGFRMGAVQAGEPSARAHEPAGLAGV
jgi:flavin reductase (DIM6/NTAB) family NADH-FMN oxidoreductase RutF